jgi:Cof subfamily protein (haloacid dehalogenase superfamily)
VGRPNKVPALIATDLDGTFLSPDGSVSEENSAAVVAAQAAGIPVLFATGRPVRWLDVIRDLPGAHPTVIASNGAALYDLGAGQLIDRICIDPDTALEAVRRIRAAVPDASFAFESGTRFGYEPAYRRWPEDDGTDPALFRGPAEQIAREEEFVKMLVQSQTVAADDLLRTVQAQVADTLTATHSQTRAFGLVEISAAGVTKATMLRRCCARLGVDPHQVAAFGDMPNDVDMLSWVGMPFVVANAHPALLALDYPVVPANDQSGVGRTIMGWLNPTPG